MDESEIFTEVDGTRERILRAALGVLQRKGYEGLSMAAIADEVGIKKSSIYHHYSNKDELMFTFLQFSMDHVVEQMATSENKTPIEQLRAVIDRAVLPNPVTGYADDDGPSEVVVATYIQTRAQAVHQREYCEQMSEMDTALKKEVTDIIDDAKEQGYMYDTDSEQLAETLLTFGKGALQRQVTAKNVEYHRIRDGIHRYVDQFVPPEHCHSELVNES